MKNLEFDQIKTKSWLFHLAGSSVVSSNDNETARVNEGRRVSSKSPSLARAVEAVMSKETDETCKSFIKKLATHFKT